MERNCEACKYYVTSEDGKTKGCSRWECQYDERMTNEEAIRILENYKPEVKRATLAAKRAKEAFDMAISALRQQEMTNGKIFMTLFPETNIKQAKWFFGTDWWNAPYKAESEVKPNETDN